MFFSITAIHLMYKRFLKNIQINFNYFGMIVRDYLNTNNQFKYFGTLLCFVKDPKVENITRISCLMEQFSALVEILS